jgi:hypothetical protein
MKKTMTTRNILYAECTFHYLTFSRHLLDSLIVKNTMFSFVPRRLCFPALQ